ncbi:hypothetical protein [uncultured Thiodictyon sp.]|uniref:hypothetical protein n=1 Tax=uncultured Thiodictyon sp. TaxID=1846217 RepID=UPI0025D02F90|nr:hypothetical protein [uncultured Thiodictyon sp.]
MSTSFEFYKVTTPTVGVVETDPDALRELSEQIDDIDIHSIGELVEWLEQGPLKYLVDSKEEETRGLIVGVEVMAALVSAGPVSAAGCDDFDEEDTVTAFVNACARSARTAEGCAVGIVIA